MCDRMSIPSGRRVQRGDFPALFSKQPLKGIFCMKNITVFSISLIVFFIVFILVVCSFCFPCFFEQVLTSGAGISSGVRIDDTRNRINECRVWRRDIKRYSFFTTLPPIVGKDWGCAWFYIIDSDKVLFSWKIHSGLGDVVIELNNDVNSHTIRFRPIDRNTIFYTDIDGNLREYSPHVNDTKFNEFFVQAIMHPPSESDYHKFWEELQKVNTESNIVFPLSPAVQDKLLEK